MKKLLAFVLVCASLYAIGRWMWNWEPPAPPPGYTMVCNKDGYTTCLTEDGFALEYMASRWKWYGVMCCWDYYRWKKAGAHPYVTHAEGPWGDCK